MIGFAAQRLMELEVGGQTGRPYWRGESRTPGPAQRLPRPDPGDPCRRGRAAHPKLRNGSYFPAFLEPRRMAEKALTAVV
jgi:putative transposase